MLSFMPDPALFERTLLISKNKWIKKINQAKDQDKEAT